MEIVENFKSLPLGLKFIVCSGVLMGLVSLSSLPKINLTMICAVGLGLSGFLIYKKLELGRYLYFGIWLFMYIKALFNIDGPIYKGSWPVIGPIIVITIFWYLFFSKSSKQHFEKETTH